MTHKEFENLLLLAGGKHIAEFDATLGGIFFVRKGYITWDLKHPSDGYKCNRYSWVSLEHRPKLLSIDEAYAFALEHLVKANS